MDATPHWIELRTNVSVNNAKEYDYGVCKGEYYELMRALAIAKCQQEVLPIYHSSTALGAECSGIKAGINYRFALIPERVNIRETCKKIGGGGGGGPAQFHRFLFPAPQMIVFAGMRGHTVFID